MSARDEAIEILRNSLDKDGGELRSRHVLQAQACADALLGRPDLLATMAVEADLKEALEAPEVAIHDVREALGAGEEQRAIAQVGLELITMLLAKNRRYGSSATNPIRVFSKLDPIEGIHLRMDDKLSRIRAGAADDDEDPVWDLGGYCVLELVARRKGAS